MLETALSHFDDDIARAYALHQHGASLTQEPLRSDILRSSWMVAVGACDAYFSDAYADLVSRAIRAKEREANVEIPDRLNNLKVPVTAILREHEDGWRWRMAARELIEDENVLSLGQIQRLFNHFFRKSHKLVNKDTLEPWIVHPKAKNRLFGISATEYRKLNASQKGKKRADALEKFHSRFEVIFQRRHDCIHNCDRPKVSPQPIGDTQVAKVIEDIEFLVRRCHGALLAEFPEYLKGLGFSSVTRNRVGA